jgi:hypothetical protein
MPTQTDAGTRAGTTMMQGFAEHIALSLSHGVQAKPTSLRRPHGPSTIMMETECVQGRRPESGWRPVPRGDGPPAVTDKGSLIETVSSQNGSTGTFVILSECELMC